MGNSLTHTPSLRRSLQTTLELVAIAESMGEHGAVTVSRHQPTALLHRLRLVRISSPSRLRKRLAVSGGRA